MNVPGDTGGIRPVSVGSVTVRAVIRGNWCRCFRPGLT